MRIHKRGDYELHPAGERGGRNGGGGAYSGTFDNCHFAGNRAEIYAGGVAQAILNGCLILSNTVRAYSGGGAQYSVLRNCVVRGNSGYYAGGVHYCTTYESLICSNAAMTGGGAIGGTLERCIMQGNVASNWGGGAYSAGLNNCLLAGNAATNLGGGALSCALTNCTVAGNHSGKSGGGAAQCSPVNNCILYFNAALTDGANFVGGGTPGSIYNYCCATPMPPAGTGNITNAPLFVDAPKGNYLLQAGSPCINSGKNALSSSSPDLAGQPRVAAGTVDIGSYELQEATSVLAYAWAQGYGLATDGTADFTDGDLDRHNNWQEWVAGTDPTNAASVLRLEMPVIAPCGWRLRWNSGTNADHFVERAGILVDTAGFQLLGSNIPGGAGQTSYTDYGVPVGGACYRVGTASSNAPLPILLAAPELVPGTATITWSSVTNRVYCLERGTSLGLQSGFNVLRTNLPGLQNSTSFTDTNLKGPGPYYYRVRVEE